MKTISHDDYLKAKALFTIASEHAREAEKFEATMARLLGADPMSAGHVSDDIWSPQFGFEEALKLSGFQVEPEQT